MKLLKAIRVITMCLIMSISLAALLPKAFGYEPVLRAGSLLYFNAGQVNAYGVATGEAVAELPFVGYFFLDVSETSGIFALSGVSAALCMIFLLPSLMYKEEKSTYTLDPALAHSQRPTRGSGRRASKEDPQQKRERVLAQARRRLEELGRE